MAKRKSSHHKLIFMVALIGMLAGITWYLGPENLPIEAMNHQVDNLKAKIHQLQSSSSAQPGDKQVSYKFALLADVHEDTHHFPAIIDQIAARDDLEFVVSLGDLTNSGDKAKLQQGKDQLDRVAVPVHVLPGDHDLNWYPRHDLTNFKQVFNQTRTSYSLTRGDQHYIFLDNSDLNRGIDATTWNWLKTELDQYQGQQIYVMMSTPLSNPYLAFKAMGSQSETVKTQAADLGQLLKAYNVKATFAGDTHTFAQYQDKATGLPIITVGAAGSTKNPLPMYVVVEILSDGSYNVTSVPTSSGIPIQGDD